MPGRNGIELIKQIKDEKPALRILVLTMHAEQQYAARAFKAGAAGYLTKESASAELVAAVTKVAAGGVYVSLAMAERLAQSLAQSLNEPSDTLPHQRLSDREFDVFQRICAGETITEIGEALCLSARRSAPTRRAFWRKCRCRTKPHSCGMRCVTSSSTTATSCDAVEVVPCQECPTQLRETLRQLPPSPI